VDAAHPRTMSRQARFAFYDLRAIVRIVQRSDGGAPTVACAGDRRVHTDWLSDVPRAPLGARGRQRVANVVPVESHATICYH